MKSRDIAIVGILLAIGMICRYIALIIPGPLTSNLVIAFYCLAIILVVPTFIETIGIGLIAGIICFLISHSLFPPGNLISEPVGAIVCLATFILIRNRTKYAPGITTFVATLASGFLFTGIMIFAAFTILPDITNDVTAKVFQFAFMLIVFGTAIVNALIVQICYKPASRVLIRG